MLIEYEQLKEIIIKGGFPQYRYTQLLVAVFAQRKGNFEQMHNLPQKLRELLKIEVGQSICSLRVVKEQACLQAKKILFELADNNKIEAVGLHYKKGWESFCISSQCGCSFGCKFCATATMGLKRNLSAKEITDQLLYFHLCTHDLDSVSFMGMGEPLANPYIFDAISQLTDKKLFAMSQRKITLSTVGIIPQLVKLSTLFPQVNIAFSLHSPFESQRSELMPINNKYPLHEVMHTLVKHIEKTRRKVFIAYIMLQGINDSLSHARAVAQLLKNNSKYTHLFHVDLIVYNTSDVTSQFKGSKTQQVERFAAFLKNQGINVSIRMQFGTDINAACGQLCT